MRSKYQLAIYLGLLFRSLGFPKYLFGKVRQYFPFLSILDFLLNHGDSIKWLGRDSFSVRRLGIVFHIPDDFWWLCAYFEVQNKIRVFLSDNKLYADVQDMTFLLSGLVNVAVLKETFLDECYGFWDFADGVVVDVGGYIGDTAVYFARQGAKKVIVFEPNKEFFEIAKENVASNGYERVVKIVNEAVEDSVSIQKCIDELGPIDLMKMDCEGAEWKIIPQAMTDGSLSMISKICMEVHFNFDNLPSSPDQMIRFLTTAGFKIIYPPKVPHSGRAFLIAAQK